MNGIDSALEQIKLLSPNKIIGVGDCSGRDNGKLRIETKCNQKFRNTYLSEYTKTDLNRQVQPQALSKYSTGLGNSWCNLLSLAVINKTTIPYSFIHIPKKLNTQKAADELVLLLSG